MPRMTRVEASAAAAVVMLAGWLIGGWGGEHVVALVAELTVVSAAAFAAGCTAVAAVSASGRARTAWICMTVGVVGWAVGQTVWAYDDLLLHTDPIPSAAKLTSLLLPIGTFLALVLLPTGRSRQSRIRLVLDGFIVAGSLSAILWVAVLRRLYEAHSGNHVEVAVSMIHPLSGIVVLTVALLMLDRARLDQRPTLTLLLLGTVSNALSDSAWLLLDRRGTYVGDILVNVGWAVGLLLIGIAALVSRRSVHVEEPTRVPRHVSMWLPYVALVLAAAVSIPRFLPTTALPPLVITWALLVIAVCVRQFLMVRDHRRLFKAVAEQALRDPLTGLANRALFHDRLTHAIQRHERDGQSVAVMSLDLDDFKLVNDTLGHSAGDALLKEAAQRISGCVRTGDSVGRLGGDEFAVVVEGEAEHSQLVAQRIMEAFEAPFAIDGQDFVIRASVGIAVASSDDQANSADALLRRADVAMLSAKRSRKSGVHTFTPDMPSPDPIEVERRRKAISSAEHGGVLAIRLLGELRDAIDHLDLRLVYQPKFDMHSRDVVGVEALVRWPHARRGLLRPDDFLPMVRQHGLMSSVTELVLAQSLDQVAEWGTYGLRIPLAVNVFAPSIGDVDLPHRIADALRDRNIAPELLTIEITEDLLLQNTIRTRAVLYSLRERGIRVSLDDFGSGYSALWCLRELLIDEVKLGRQFIDPLLVNPRAAAIVRAVVDLANELELTVVAEGVENAETAAILRDYGCTAVQGYYYSEPMAAPEMLAFLKSTTPAPAAARSS